MDAVYLRKLGDYDLEELQEAWLAACGPDTPMPSMSTLSVDPLQDNLLRAA